ncbi:MAG: hypothetical protein AAF403_02040 [Pseudomonadota bacterium]
MCTNYLSKNACKEDPAGLIGDAVAMGDAFTGPAHDLFLAWYLQIDINSNAQKYAQILLKRFPELTMDSDSKALCELGNLLKSTILQPQAGQANRRRRQTNARTKTRITKTTHKT